MNIRFCNYGKILPVFVSLLVLLFFCAGSPAYGAQVWKIVPGISVGWVTVNQTYMYDLMKSFGKEDYADNTNRIVSYKSRFGLKFIYSKQSVQVSSVLVLVESTGGVQYVTDTGISVGNNQSDVQTKLGPPRLNNRIHPYQLMAYINGAFFTSYIFRDSTLVGIWTGSTSDYSRLLNKAGALMK